MARVIGLAVLAGTVISEVTAAVLHLPSAHARVATVVLVAASVAIARLRRDWNAAGVWFFASLLVAEGTYLTIATAATFDGGLRPAGVLLSGILLLLEAAGLVLAATFAFETCDVVCRVRPCRPEPLDDPDHQPFVSIHVAAYNEPPDMLIETIRSLEAIEYPAFEIVVIDNNTEDAEVWEPVEAYCADRDGVRFVHVNPWPGYKSGALNLALSQHTDPRAEIIGIVDADYLVAPGWLADLTGRFVDPTVAFVQTPQDYREWEGDTWLTACHDSYAYFFATSMRSRHQRNSPIFGGTMGLLRRSVLVDIGGWDEWCITEDAEASLRILAEGHQGIYVHRSYGQGIMPLTFDALKRQRFRWCFGGIQILRKHHRRLIPWQRHPTDRLSTAQRLDYLIGGLQWGSDLVSVGFAFVVACATAAVLSGQPLTFRPLGGPLVALPATLALTGLLRTVWALRRLLGISTRRAVFAFATWLSLSLTVAYATTRGIVRRDGVFLRTPKWHEGGGLLDALRSTRAETTIAVALAAAAAAVALTGGSLTLAAFAAWQSSAYLTAPVMAWLNFHTELSSRLQRRQRTEERRDRRERFAEYQPHLAGLSIALLLLGGASLLALATTDPGTPRRLDLPERPADDRGLLGDLDDLGGFPNNDQPEATTTTTTATTATTTTTTTEATTGAPPVSSPSTPVTSDGGSTPTSAAAPTTTTIRPGSTPPTTVATPAPPTSSSPPTSSGPPSTTPSTPSNGPPSSLPGGRP